MIPNHQAKLSRGWMWTAAVGLALFLLIQVFPTSYSLFQSDNHDVLPRTQAENLALGIAERQFGITRSEIGDATVTHLSDSDAVGYYAKNHLLSDYNEQWDATMPTDYYRVDLHLGGQSGTLLLLLHLETGKLVGWRHQATNVTAAEFPAGGDDMTASKALRYAEAWGIDSASWEWSGIAEKDGSTLFFHEQPALGEAKPWLKVRMPASFNEAASSIPPWEGGYLIYGTQLPLDFLVYKDNQERLASKFSTFGYIVPQLFMLVCAVVAAGVYAAHSSYRRGIFLAGLFVALYIVFTYNMIPGLRAGAIGISTSARDALSDGVVTASIIIYAAMGLLTYLSAVGGDGVWNKMGLKLWPRWQESDYGDSVLRSMKTGYFLAFILLGVQSVILIALEQSIGSFAASDPTQSMYNMIYPWLLPILAWCAGISEEMQSRFFGIGLFRRWLVGGTKKLLGREPSARTISCLTFAAMLPPGMLWAFGHVGYAVYPIYTRLIELVLLSLLFGWFMLRFGLMAVIFAHVTLDGVLMGFQMITDGLPGDYWAGLFSLLMPGLAGIVIWRLHRYAFRSRGTA
ncbi:CPBP family glutamic-type intramembrane protease [Cohnella panacarvi]|uniref:CPBP family glutamic-type intramembrane protease n=1 Tax=Cohnella panacarvi TaxID=400776 RepID=UPI000479B90D|nr:CPBP family glutamic-type intramembrane protease [Cohnella panacarvi]